MVNKRSLTIVEMLIVIALLAAMASMIVPLIADSLNERAFESAADVTGEQLVLARAHAQATGEPVEVRYYALSAQVEARLFTPWLPGIEPWSSWTSAGAPQAHAVNPDPALGRNSTNASEDDCTIAEPWATRSLSNGIRIVNHPPANNNDDDAALTESSAGDVLAQLGLPGQSDSDIRLAVFMPDGSALMGAPVWFNDDDGRLGKLTINPWTGLPMFERLNEPNGEGTATSADPSMRDDATRPGATPAKRALPESSVKNQD